MRFIELHVPDRHRAVVDALVPAVRDACAGVALARTATVEVRSGGADDFVVFTLADPLGGRTATVECGVSEPPGRVGRRACQAAWRLIHGTAILRKSRLTRPGSQEPVPGGGA